MKMNGKKMTTEDARQYFKKCNIDYSKISHEDINKLIELLNIELKPHKHFPMRISKIVRFYCDDLPSMPSYKFKACHLYVNGSYFNKRQAISFESDDWIGFCGWADSGNTKPFINAFVKWCDWMVTQKRGRTK